MTTGRDESRPVLTPGTAHGWRGTGAGVRVSEARRHSPLGRFSHRLLGAFPGEPATGGPPAMNDGRRCRLCPHPPQLSTTLNLCRSDAVWQAPTLKSDGLVSHGENRCIKCPVSKGGDTLAWRKPTLDGRKSGLAVRARLPLTECGSGQLDEHDDGPDFRRAPVSEVPKRRRRAESTAGSLRAPDLAAPSKTRVPVPGLRPPLL
jgi:hypothetical protein